jgi:hypothetical protein
MRSFVAALIVLAVLYFWDKEYNNGRLLDGLDSMRRSISPQYVSLSEEQSPLVTGLDLEGNQPSAQLTQRLIVELGLEGNHPLLTEPRQCVRLSLALSTTVAIYGIF